MTDKLTHLHTRTHLLRIFSIAYRQIRFTNTPPSSLALGVTPTRLLLPCPMVCPTHLSFHFPLCTHFFGWHGPNWTIGLSLCVPESSPSPYVSNILFVLPFLVYFSPRHTHLPTPPLFRSNASFLYFSPILFVTFKIFVIDNILSLIYKKMAILYRNEYDDVAKCTSSRLSILLLNSFF